MSMRPSYYDKDDYKRNREWILARQKAVRAAETPEQRSARLDKKRADSKRRYYTDLELSREKSRKSQVRYRSKPEKRKLAIKATREWRARVKRELFSMLAELQGTKEPQCRECEEKDPRVLQIDHINGGGCGDRQNRGARYSRWLKELKAGRRDLQILCSNHNWKKRYREGGVTPLPGRMEAIKRLGGRCGLCLEDDPEMLHVDHIKGGGRKEIERWGISRLRFFYSQVAESPGKYQVLCSNCNWKKRVELREQN